MSSFTVHTPVLGAAALIINGAADTVGEAHSAATSAAGQAGAFEGEPIGAAFESMCARAQAATTELQTTMQTLSQNVAAAAMGYLVTDQGVIPITPGGKVIP